MTTNYPFKSKALQVVQPLGTYYVAIVPADILLDVSFSDRLRARQDGESGYRVDGTQRARSSARQPQIEDYIGRKDSAFPNSIILAANYEPETGHIRTEEPAFEEEENKGGTLWTVQELEDGCFELTIPTGEKLAGIVRLRMI